MTTGDPTQQPLLAVKLRDGGDAQLWPDRLTAPSGSCPLAQLTGALLVADPAAPPLPNGMPAPAVQLHLADGRAPVFTPADPPDANRLLAAIHARRPDLRYPGFPPLPFPPQSDAAHNWTPPPPPPGYAPAAAAYGPNYLPPQARQGNETGLAGLAHLSIFFAPLILPLILWLTQRQTAPYASYQAKQAFFWHLLFSVAGFVIAIVLIFGFVLPNAIRFSSQHTPDPFAIFGPFIVVWAVAAALGLVEIVFGIIGAVKSFRGEPFHYPLLGGL